MILNINFFILFSYTHIYDLVKSLTDIYHPIWEFPYSLIDQSIRHLFVIGVCHGASDSSEGVCITTKGYGEFDAVHIVF